MNSPISIGRDRGPGKKQAPQPSHSPVGAQEDKRQQDDTQVIFVAAIRGLSEKELRPGRLLHQPQQNLDSLGDAPLKGHCLARWRILINLNVLSLYA